MGIKNGIGCIHMKTVFKRLWC